MFKNYFDGKDTAIFDLDGTLVDSHPIWDEACAMVSDSFGSVWRGTNFLIFPSIQEVWENYLDAGKRGIDADISELVELTNKNFFEIFLSSEPQELLKDGFITFVDELINAREFKVGMVTNTDKEIGSQMLNHLGIEPLFQAVVYGDEVSQKKPNPKIYKKVMKLLKSKSGKSLAFEDSPSGIKSAISAGLDVIRVQNKLFSEKDFSDFDLIYVNDFSVFRGNLDKTRKEVYSEALSQLDEGPEDL